MKLLLFLKKNPRHDVARVAPFGWRFPVPSTQGVLARCSGEDRREWWDDAINQSQTQQGSFACGFYLHKQSHCKVKRDARTPRSIRHLARNEIIGKMENRVGWSNGTPPPPPTSNSFCNKKFPRKFVSTCFVAKWMTKIYRDNSSRLNLWIYDQIKKIQKKKVGIGPRPHLEARRNLCVV